MTYILFQPWGGLGDNLLWSTIPEMCHKNNIDCYLSRMNAVRNQEIHDLVWGLNPFIKGFSNAPPNAGTCRWDGHTLMPCIKKAEFLHGFEPTNLYPKIYYDFKTLPEFKDKIILDFSAHNNSYDFNMLTRFVIENYDLRDVVQIRHKHKFQNSYLLDGVEVLELKDIFHYCDLINSCREFLCLFSGSSILAAAINRNNTKVFSKHGDNFNDYSNPNGLYVFDNLEYIDSNIW